MAVISGLAGVLGRFAGKLLNAALGWATILLFGKMSGSKQTLMLVVALSSLLWIVLLVGVIVPDVGTMLLAFAPVPSFISEDVVRLAMLGAAILLPLAVGAATVYLTEASDRPRGIGLIGGVLRGYPFTMLLALTIAMLATVGIVRKLQSLAKRHEDAHIALIVKPGRYDGVLRHLESVLDAGGIHVEPEPAPRVLSIPPRLLGRIAGRGIGSLVPERLMQLKGPDVDVLLYPSDISIAGTKERVAGARALIASGLTDAPAWMTTSAEAQEIEDQLRAVADEIEVEAPRGLQARLGLVDQELMRLTVPFDEWETVYRQRLQVERDVLDLADGNDVSYPEFRRVADVRSRSPADILFAGAVLAAVALDVGLLVADRLAPGGRQRR
jgi:hypothetical protein